MKKLNILISNDDGVYAPGIQILAKILKEVATVTIVAPLEERSTTGHTLTLDHPLRVVKIDDDVWGCSGYPADCTLLGLSHVLADNRPDLIISGINRGANLGQDIYYSGTVAAAREGVFHKVPAIAVSSVLDFFSSCDKAANYETAALFIKAIVEQKIHEEIEPMSLLNINVPDLKKEEILGTRVTRLGFQNYTEEITKREDFRKRPYYWIGGVYKGHIGDPECDGVAVADKYISVTSLNLLGQKSEEDSKWSQVFKNFIW